MRFFTLLWKELRETLSDGNEPDHIRLMADLYWKALLLSAFIILTLVFVYSTWGLVRILGDLSAALDTSAPPPPALNRGELNTTINAFETRQVQFDDLKRSPPAPIKDPNI